MSRYERQTGSGRRKTLSPARRRQLTLIGGVALVLVLAIGATVAVFFSKNRVSAKGESSSALSGELTEENGYDKNAHVLDTSKYTSTILGKTEDAGDDYVSDTLFIGDSNTYRFMVFGMTTLKNDIGVIGMGVQDVLTEKCVKFVGYSEYVTIPEAVKIMQPRRVVLTFGTNNAGGSWTGDYLAEQYRDILDAVSEAYPYADIIINAVPPVSQEHENQSITMSTVDEFNQALAELAKSYGCKFLNSSEALKNENTGFAKTGYTISADGLHLSKKGVEAFFDYFRTHAYETEDRRPELTAVPDRDETEPVVIGDEAGYTGTVAGSGSSSSKKAGLDIVYTVNDSEMGSLEGTTEQTVPVGQTCEAVKAVAKEGYTFSYWSCTVGRIEDVKNDTLAFAVPGGFDVEKIVVTANFVKSGYDVKVVNTDATVGTAGIRDGSNLLSELNITPGSSVSLYARLNSGKENDYEFIGWKVDGTIVSTQMDYTVTPTASVEITAVFQRIAYTTNVSAGTGGTISSSSSNGKLTVSAAPDAGYSFDYWEVNGQNFSNQPTAEIPINQNLTVVAHFKALPASSSEAAASSTAPAASSETPSSSSGPASSDSQSTGG